MGNREPLQVSKEGIRTICFVFFRKIIVNSLEDSPKWVGETCQTSCLGKNKKPVGTVSGDLPVANMKKKKKKIQKPTKKLNLHQTKTISFCYMPDALWGSPQTILLNHSYFYVDQ